MKKYRLTVENNKPIEVRAMNMASALMEAKKQTEGKIKSIVEIPK